MRSIVSSLLAIVVLLVGVIALTAGLMIFPALTLGPIVEGLMH